MPRGPPRSSLESGPTFVGRSILLFVVLSLAFVVVTAPTTASDVPGPTPDAPIASHHSSAGTASDGTNVTVYRAPPDASFESARDVEAAIADGTLEATNELETLVVAVDSRRLAGTMAPGNGSTTERFLDALSGDAEFRLVQTNPTPMKNRKVASVGSEAVTAHRNGTRTYALVETDELSFRYRSVNRSARIHGGERFAVRFGYDLAELPRGEDPAPPVIGFHPFRAEFETNGYWYEPLAPEWVGLRVNVEVEPDESLVARVRLEDGRTVATPVEPDHAPGPDRVWIDLRDVEPGTGYDLELVHDGTVVDRYDGTVREPQATLSNATLAWYGGGTALAVTVSASHGGKVQVLDESCEVLGSRWIAPGDARRVPVELRTDDGYRIQFRPDLLVRVARHRGASHALYRGPDAEVRIDYSGYCPTRDQSSTPTPTLGPSLTPSSTAIPPPSSTATPPPSSTGTAALPPTRPPSTAPGTGSAADGGGDRTSGDGGSGFTPAATLVVIVVVLFGRSDP